MSRCPHNWVDVCPLFLCNSSSNLRRLLSAKALNTASISRAIFLAGIYRAFLILSSIPGNAFQHLFQLPPEGFAFGVGGVARHADGFFINHFTPGKRQRDLKTVPTPQTQFPSQVVGDGY